MNLKVQSTIHFCSRYSHLLVGWRDVMYEVSTPYELGQLKKKHTSLYYSTQEGLQIPELV